MVKKLAIIRGIFKGDHNAVAARKLTQNQISALSGTLKYQLKTLVLGVSNITTDWAMSVITFCFYKVLELVK